MDLIEMIELDVVNLAMATAIAITLTKMLRESIRNFGADVSKFVPLIAVVSAAVAVAVLIDQNATGQDYWLAVIIVSSSAIGIHSGVKNVAQGIKTRRGRV